MNFNPKGRQLASMAWMARLASIAAPLLACALLSSCASMIGSHQIELPLARLQAGLDQRFPLNNRIMTLLDIELTHPQLTLLPDSERIALALDVSVAPPFVKRAWSGSVAMSGRLVFDAARNALVLGEIRVDRIAIDGVDEGRQRQFAKVASLAADTLIRNMPLHRFQPDDLRFAGVRFVPTHIGMTPNALLVSFEPAR